MIRSIVVLSLVVAGCSSPDPSNSSYLVIERVRYSADTTGGGFEPGELRQKIVDEYDEHGNIVYSEYLNSEGNIQMRFVSTVEDEIRIRTDWRRANDSLALYVLYGYDDQGRLIESSQYAPDGEFRRGFRSRWSDDGMARESGPLTAEEDFEPDSFFKMNDQGDDIELLEYPDVDSLRTLFTYEYSDPDSLGNWTVRRTYRDGAPAQIAIRSITYW